jgi:hypothetical protein
VYAYSNYYLEGLIIIRVIIVSVYKLLILRAN